MNRFLWPWESEVVIQYPWMLPAFLIVLSIPLSIISWKRGKR
ncbi:MAG: hypothetical protein ACQEWV_20015 [Bacillota bacterium]